MPPEQKKALRLLLTGFGPFPGAPVNPSEGLVRAAARGRLIPPPGVELHATSLPVRWQAMDETVAGLYAAIKPDIALHFGLHGLARGFRIEQRARNRAGLRADAEGALPSNPTVARDAPRFLRAGFPASKLAARLRTLRLPAEVSQDAGDYLCNMVFYLSLGRARDGQRPRLVSFVHIPEPSTLGGAAGLIRGAEEIMRFLAQEIRHRR